MKAADAIVEVLKREGVNTLFCFPTTSIIENAVAAGIRPIICRQERVGVDMADGYARVTDGRPPGVFAMQYGPGAENAFPGIATTYSDSVPVLFLPLAQSRDQSQVYPIFMANRTYASVTKQVEEIRLPESVPAVMRRAFSALKNGRAGPVMVEVPRDVVGLDIGTDSLDYTPVRPTVSAPDPHDADQAAKFCCYLESHARRIYSCIATPRVNSARELAARIKEGDLGREFTCRDIYRRGWIGLVDTETVKQALDLLEDAHWVRVVPASTGSKVGRPASPSYEVNPAVWTPDCRPLVKQ